MSLVLGPIHHWLYQQIELVEDREVELLTTFADKYDSEEIKTITTEVRDEYGELKGDTPLEEMIGDSHIHPWLESAITTAQTREAAVVKELDERYNDHDLLVKIYNNHGEKQAIKANQQEEGTDLKTAFKLLKDNLVERMPCDKLSAVTVEKNDKVVWRHDIKLHTEFWQKVGVDINLMHELYASWIKGFITAINPEIDYKREIKDGVYEDIFKL